MTLNEETRIAQLPNASPNRSYVGSTSPGKWVPSPRLDARDLLWNRLQRRQLGGFRFHRELRIPPHKVDFVCLGRRLVVEVVMDVPRDEAEMCSLKDGGYRIVRFREQDVLTRTEAVLKAILKALAEQRRK